MKETECEKKSSPAIDERPVIDLGHLIRVLEKMHKQKEESYANHRNA